MRIVEVGPRDGLQKTSIHLKPSVPAELIRRLAATGISRMEAVSFVHPQRVPHMAQPEEVVAGAAGLRGPTSVPSCSTSAALTVPWPPT